MHVLVLPNIKHTVTSCPFSKWEKRGGGTLQKLHVSHFISLSLVNASPYPLFIFYLCTISRDGHQNLKLLLIDLNQMHLIGLVKRTILVLNHLNLMFRCQVMAFRVLDFYTRAARTL